MRKKILFMASILFALLSINLNSYAQCGPGQSELTLSIDFTNDSYPDEDGWRLINLTDGITVDSACFGTYATASGVVSITICADTNKMYALYAYDDFGDGLDGSSYSIGYTYGNSIATIGTNNYNIGISLCNASYSNNQLEDSTAAFMLQYVAPAACLPPSGLSASTTSATNATLNWIENGTATQWGVEWDTAGYPAGTARNYAVVNTDTFLTISGLMAQSSYDFAVRAICSSTDSSADVSSSFITPCVGVSTFPYTENFDGSLTNNVWDCWTVIDADNAGGTWEQNNTYISARSGTWTAHGMGNNNDHLITPQLILPAGTNMRMKVWDIVESSSQPNDYSVLVSTTGTAIADFTDTLASYRATNTTWTERTVDLSAYTGQTVYISLWQSFSNSSFWGFGLDDFLVEATPACLAPSANSGTVLTATSANLNWIENGTATQWEVEWDTNGFTLGTGNSVIVNTDTFTTLSGLTAQSAYQWRVRAICGSLDTSAWTSLNSFMTPCAPLVAPMLESFDATSLPNCWSRYQTTGSGWVFGTPGFSWNNSGCSGSTPVDHTGNSGNYAALDFSVPDAGTVLELPTVDVSALTAPFLKFYFTMCGNGYSPLNVLYVETFDGTNWNLTDSIRQGTNGWEEFNFVLTPYVYNTNLLKVRFRAESGGSNLVFYGDMAIDDVSIEEAPTCPDPSNLSTFNVTASSAQVTWQDNSSATSWLLEWDTAGFAVGTANNSMVVTNDSAAITGLMQLTNYDWNVRAICAVGDSSNFIGGSFMTLATCPAPSTLSANTLSFDSTELNWTDNSSATSWEIEYGVQGFTLGTGTTVITTTNPDTISGLMGDTPYSWYVRAICSSSDSSTWTGPNNFRTPCAPFTPTYSEDFSSYIPNCWSEAKGQLTANTVFTDPTSSFWAADGWLNVGTTGAARMNIWSTGRFEWLISPSIDLGASGHNYELVYEVGLTDFGNSGPDVMGADDTLSVVISTDNGATWSSANVLQLYDVNAPPSNTGDTVIIDLSAYTGTIKIGFYATSTISNTDYNVYIDNFEIRETPLPYYPIATINTEDANSGIADSTGVTCFTSGTVAGIDLDGNNGYSFTIIDMSSGSQEGINIFNFNDVSNYVVTEGDSIMVRGTVGQFRGLTQFVPDSIMIVSTGNALPAPIVVSNLDETTESKWLSISTSWVSLSTSGTGSSNVELTNGTDTITMRIDSDTDINDSLVAQGAIIPGDTICGLFGIGGQFNSSTSAPFTNGYQIFPMRWSDLTICRFVPPVVLPYYPIGTINTEDATTGVADSLNVVCFTSGTVVGIDLDGNNGISFTIIDMSSGSQEGINIFNFNDVSNYVVTEGDSIMVRGTVGQFRGLTQFVPDSIMIVSTGNALPAPIVISNLDETTESKWLSISASWVSLSTSGTGSSNVELTNGTDTITMRIDSDTDINDSLVAQGAIIPGDTICGLFGIGGQFNSSTSAPFTNGYQIFPMRWSDLTICRFVPPVVLPYYPIGTINTEDATTGVADSLNVVCFTSGTVVGIDLDGNNGISFTIVDMSSGSQEGMNIFNFNDVSNYVVNEGDSILVRGSIIQFNGLTELSPDSISIISTGSAIPAPIVVTSLDETTESRWLSIPTNYVALNTSGSGSSNVDLTNGTDTITMRIDSDTDINDSLNASNPIAIGDTICGLFGIGGQFDNSSPYTSGYQIFPMRWSDLTICRNTTGIETEEVVNSEFLLVPNPTNGLFEIRSSGFNNATVAISIRDISGRLISSEIVNNANGNFIKSFDLNEESAGIYFITIIDGESVINEKLILK